MSSIRGAGGFSKPSIRKRPALDSSESTTRVLIFLVRACFASNVTSALLPLPPFPQTDIFISFSSCHCTEFQDLFSNRVKGNCGFRILVFFKIALPGIRALLHVRINGYPVQKGGIHQKDGSVSGSIRVSLSFRTLGTSCQNRQLLVDAPLFLRSSDKHRCRPGPLHNRPGPDLRRPAFCPGLCGVPVLLVRYHFLWAFDCLLSTIRNLNDRSGFKKLDSVRE